MSKKPAKPAAKPIAKPAAKPQTETASSSNSMEYQIGDEISFASAQGMLYGTVVKIVKDPSSPAIEIEFEDGRKEVKKVRDRALRLLRRASGRSELDERRGESKRHRDQDIEDVRKSEQRRGSRH